MGAFAASARCNICVHGAADHDGAEGPSSSTALQLLGKVAHRWCRPRQRCTNSTTPATLGRETLSDSWPEVLKDSWGVCRYEFQAGSNETAWFARLCVAGVEVQGKFNTREEAEEFQARQLQERCAWPRASLAVQPVRSPIWDHSEELEPCKEYSFKEATSNCDAGRHALSGEQLRQFNAHGFLLGLPVLDATELDNARREFDVLLRWRLDRATSDEEKFRSAHTIHRPLHQNLVRQLASNKRVLAIVEDILGPRFVCWSAHLFCKLPGDPTEQPWHQDAGFWPLSQSRALTLWLAIDDADADNAAVTFVEGSHRLGRLKWQPTDTEHHLLTQQIPDVELLGPLVQSRLRAGEASVHSDLTVHGSAANTSTRRRAGIALRFVGSGADCLGPMINGYRMNGGCILPKGKASDPRGHWRQLRRRSGGTRTPRCKQMLLSREDNAESHEQD